MNIKYSILLFLHIFINVAQSQSWSGQWIWQMQDGPANTWSCFRKSFNIDTLPNKAIAKIAVDSKYWLWVNGKMVIFEGGLKNGPSPNNSYYDTVDLTGYLKTGKNVLAFQVWFFGKDGFSHKNSGKGGLLFECTINDTTIISDSSWKMIIHPAYSSTTEGSEPNYRLSESNIRFDAQKDTLGDWLTFNYNDSSWSRVVEKGTPPTAPWNNLWIRPIPQWKNSGLINYSNISVSLPYTSTAETSIIAKLPYNAQVTPYFEIDAPAGKIIDIRTDDYNGINIRTEYITKTGSQKFESFAWINGHYVIYKIPAGVTVKSLKYRESGYNSELSGSFSCNDTFFNALWTKAQRTLYVNMRDNYMDCPDRERALWWGDATIEIGQSFYALDRKSDLLTKKSISNLVEWQRSDNTLFSPIPSIVWESELPIQMLASIGQYGFWNYFWNSGDTSTIIDAYPHVKKYLSVWSFDADGMVIFRTGGYEWTDWGRYTDTRLVVNCWYYLALKTAREMAILTNNANDTSIYNPQIQSIKTNFNKVFWQNDVYKSPAHTTKADDRGNALAVLTGLAEKDKWPYIQLVLEHERNASPYMEKYVLEALYLMGYENKAMERMKRQDRYAPMVTDPSTTLYELFNNEGTYNHGWSGGPLTVLSQYGVGVATETAGYGVYHVFPQEGSLTTIKSVTPSIKGNIIVDIKKDSSSYSLKLYSPVNTLAIVGIPRYPFTGKCVESISINGNIAWQDYKFVNTEKSINYIGEDSKYHKFSVKPGEYNFVAALKDTVNNKVSSIDATLASLKYDTINLRIFDAFRTSYTIALPFDSDIPTVSATLNDSNATMVFSAPTTLPGSYFIEVTAEDGKTKKIYEIKFILKNNPNSVYESKINSINFYPVPVDKNLTISNVSVLKCIEVYSLEGNLLSTEIVRNSTVTINVSALKTGIYLIRLTDKDNKIIVSKFVKK
jgi:alpha-L-rhamnosidase